MPEYLSTACLLAKTLNIVMYYQYNVLYAVVYAVICLLHFVFIPQPVYDGPEFITYFRGPHLKNEMNRDKRVTWMICFYAAWSPNCVTVAPMIAEISNEYHLDNLKFGKLDVSRYPAVAEEYRINTSSFSKQLPTLIIFQDGKEKIRRPAISAKGTVLKYTFTKQNIINDFELNELYNQCKKTLPKQNKDNLEEKKKK